MKVSMKKLLATVLVAIIILSVTATAFATRETAKVLTRTTIKVGYLENYGIINTPIVQGSEGYGFEYLEKIEEYSPYDFEYVSLSWAEGLAQLQSGEIGILAPASMSAERKEIYDFVDTVFLHEETNIYALEDSAYQYGVPQQLDGKIVGTLEGSIYENRLQAYAKEHDLDCTIKHTDPVTAVQDLKSGIIDFYLDGSLHLRDGIYSVEELYAENLYLMVQKGNNALKNALDAAMVAMEADDSSYNEFLWYKYYAHESKAPRKLTEVEQMALQSKPFYTVGYHADLAPVSYTASSGAPDGYAIGVMDLLAEKLGIQVRYVPLHDGTEDRNEHRENTLDFNLCPLRDDCAIDGTLSDPYDTQSLLIVKNEGLENYAVQDILVKDYATIQIDEFLQDYPAATIHKSYSSADSQRISDTAEIDCIIIPDRSEMLIYDKTVKNVQVLDVDVPSGIMVSNDLPKGVQTALNKAIASLKKSTVDELEMEKMIELQATPTFLDALIRYQIQILAGFLLIITVFVLMLLEHQKRTKQLLEVDTLTGVMTQYKFAYEARRILAGAKPDEYMLLLLDVDKFKSVNKVYGTAMGDKLLCMLANSIKRQVKKGAIVGRIQGDAFAILTVTRQIPQISLNDQFVDEHFMKKLKQEGIDIPVYFSIGVYRVEHPADDISFMLDNARTAKGYGKKVFGNTIHYFTKKLQAKHDKESEVLSSVETALTNEEFFILVQPKLDLRTQRLVGGEVLVRWQKKDGTFIYPDEFIPLLEENEFIAHLDQYVLEKTCEFIKNSALPLPILSVNVSATTMLEPDFMAVSYGVLQQYGIAPGQLEVELTESVLDADYKRISDIITALKKIGAFVAIDDFGKGASSLARLKEIEIDVLKLDKEFMEHNAENEKGKLVLKNVISLANDLGITCLAEGIETEEQLDLLIQLGCEQGQGYYFDRPLSLADFTRRVEANAALGTER